MYKKYANWPLIKSSLGQPFSPVHPPAGFPVEYLYAQIPHNGQIYEYMYLPNARVGSGKVPLLLIRDGKLTLSLSSKPDYRMASRYARGFPKLLGARTALGGRSQLHHLVPDNVARDHPFFQLAFRRGLFGLDEQTNIIEIAEDTASLKLANPEGGAQRLAPLIHNGSHPDTDDATKEVIRKVLERYTIDIEIDDLDSMVQSGQLSDARIKQIIKEIQITIRNMYRNGDMPTKPGTVHLSYVQKEEYQWT